MNKLTSLTLGLLVVSGLAGCSGSGGSSGSGASGAASVGDDSAGGTSGGCAAGTDAESSSDAPPHHPGILGTWVNENETIKFAADGTCEDIIPESNWDFKCTWSTHGPADPNIDHPMLLTMIFPTFTDTYPVVALDPTQLTVQTPNDGFITWAHSTP